MNRSYTELLLAKILALFHDPPNKSLIITGAIKKKEHVLAKILRFRLNYPLTRVLSAYGEGSPEHRVQVPLHLLEALLVLQGLLKTRLGEHLAEMMEKVDESLLNRIVSSVKGADHVAASFDRWVSDQLATPDKCGVFRGVLIGLVNTFNPLILMYDTSLKKDYLSKIFSGYKEKYKDVLGEDIYEISHYPRKLRDVVGGINYKAYCLNVLLHVLENVVEPLWYEVYPRIIMPADTRSPTHSVFDHLYATAMATGITGDLKQSGKRRLYSLSGLFVGVGVGGLWEWLNGSRKLSDLWFSSWLATAMVWYSVKELVWCFGGDVLLTPGFRWNHFYYSLLKEKLGEDFKVLEEFLRRYAFYEGFPYYAWIPASIIMVLPNNVSVDEEQCCRNGCMDVVSRLQDVKGYLEERFNEAWRKVVNAVISVAEEEGLRIGEWLRSIRDSGLLDEPPLKPVVIVEDISGEYSLNEAKKLYAEKFNKVATGLEEGVKKSLPVWARNKALLEVTRGGKGLPLCSSIDGEMSEEIRRYRWRHCSVCGYAPAVIRIPGRDLPGGEVSREYKDWAYRNLCREGEDYDRCWRKWRPVFRPGERLCPYCLVKRLAGLPEFFNKIARELVGYEPPHGKEVVFPSTSDVAALATKIALLKLLVELLDKERLYELLKEVVGKEEVGLEDLREIVDALAVELRRSRVHTELKESLDKVLAEPSIDNVNNLFESVVRLIDKRYWTPRLLRYYVYDLRRLLKDKLGVKDQGDERLVELLFIAAVLLFVDSEIEEALLEDSPRAMRARDVLRKIARALRRVLAGEDWVSDAVEALVNPRRYYGVIAFDVDGLGLARRGLLFFPKARRPLGVGRYLDMVRLSVYVGVGKTNRLVRQRILANFLDRQMLLKVREFEENSPKYKDLIEWSGSVLVSPSYHQALSNSIAYTLLRLAIVAEKLGGIPVYMGGDEGLIIAPAWLPWSLVRKGAWGYRDEVLNAIVGGKGKDRESKDEVRELSRLASPNPSAIIALLAKRIMWASSSRVPGFHPVKKIIRKGSGDTRLVVMWRIPALVSTGLSVGLRFAHYRDPMREELRAAEYLVDMVKEEDGDGVVVSYGRPGYMLTRRSSVRASRELIPVLKFNNEARVSKVYEKRISGVLNGKIVLCDPVDVEGIREDVHVVLRHTGSTLTLALLLQGFVENNVFSKSLLYDLDKMWGTGVDVEVVEEALENMPVSHVVNIIRRLFERNTTRTARRITGEKADHSVLAERLLELFSSELKDYSNARAAFNLFKNVYYSALLLDKSMRPIE